jgi:hypothetical protein
MGHQSSSRQLEPLRLVILCPLSTYLLRVGPPVEALNSPSMIYDFSSLTPSPNITWTPYSWFFRDVSDASSSSQTNKFSRADAFGNYCSQVMGRPNGTDAHVYRSRTDGNRLRISSMYLCQLYFSPLLIEQFTIKTMQMG